MITTINPARRPPPSGPRFWTAGSKPLGLLGLEPSPDVSKAWLLEVGTWVHCSRAEALEPELQGGVDVVVHSGRADIPEPPDTQGGVGVVVHSGRADIPEPPDTQGSDVAVFTMVEVAVLVAVGVFVWVASGLGWGVLVGGRAVGGSVCGGLVAQSGRPGKPQVGPGVSVGQAGSVAGSQLCARTA